MPWTWKIINLITNFVGSKSSINKLTMSTTEQRITLQLKSPNPLFMEWLQEWLKYAEQKNSLKRHSLAKALESLQKYPLVMYTGRDCSILEGFGPGICRMIDKQLAAYHAKNGQSSTINAEREHNASVQEVIKKVQSKLYERRKKTTKKTLNLATETSNAEVIHASSGSNIISDNRLMFLFLPNNFQIILLVDTQETIGKSKRNLDATIQALNDKKILHEVRRLSVGDFLWIARNQKNEEVVLPYIVERKRMDDLAGSIKDGRFSEQKFRLKDSGIQNIIYLIENRGNNQHVGLPLSNLLQAATNANVHNKFIVKFTDSHADSMLYLTVLTQLLVKIFENKRLIVKEKINLDQLINVDDEIFVMEYKKFSQSTIKMRNFTIKDLFVRQLLQLKSLSLDKALAIVEHYPTPTSLLEAYRDCVNIEDAENLLATIKFGKLKSLIGSTISTIIHKFYNNRQAS